MPLRHLLISLLAVLGGLWAPPAAAALIINEVAWMGSTASPNHEWIELYNSGNDAVVVHEWTLSDGANFATTLTGTIAPNTYAVLERTSEDSAPGTAFFIYTGALVNTGATLTLRRSDGQIEDQVVGGENWQSIGGDNTTKASAQYTKAGWITAAATPGARNAERSEMLEEVVLTPPPSAPRTGGTVNSGGSVGTASRTSAVPLVRADSILTLDIEGQRIAYVNQKVPFKAIPSGTGDTITNSLKYQWNFGDFTTASGSQVTHAYAFPGTYIVTARAQYARHNTLARHEITVLPVALTLAYTAAGVLQVSNTATYDVDVSRFTVHVGGKTVVFPPDSLIMAKQTVTLKLPLAGGMPLATLADTAGVVVATTQAASEQGETISAKTEPMVVASLPPAALTGNTAASAFNFDSAILPLRPDPVEAVVTSTSLQEEAVLVSASDTQEVARAPVWWPYVVLFGVLMMALLAVYYARTHDPEQRG